MVNLITIIRILAVVMAMAVHPRRCTALGLGVWGGVLPGSGGSWGGSTPVGEEETRITSEAVKMIAERYGLGLVSTKKGD